MMWVAFLTLSPLHAATTTATTAVKSGVKSASKGVSVSQKPSFATPVVVSGAPWTRKTYMSGKTIVGTSVVAASPSGPEASSALPPVIVHINGLDALTQHILPKLADENDLGDLEKSATLWQGTFKVDDPFYGWRNCIDLKVSYSLGAELDLDSNDVSASFTDGKILKSAWDLDTNSGTLSGSVKAVVSKGDHYTNAFCLAGWDTLFATVMGTNSISVTSDDFSGDLNVKLDQVVDSTVSVKDIQNIDFAFDVDVSTQGWVASLLDAIASAALSISDLFGSGCNSYSSCASKLVTTFVNSDDVSDKIVAAVNDSIEYAAAIDGTVSESGLSLDYGLSLSELKTGTDTNMMTASWAAELESDGESDDCAENLSESSYEVQTGSALDHDVDVNIGYAVLSRAIFLAGDQGAFCRRFNGSFSLGSDALSESSGVGSVMVKAGVVTSLSSTLSYAGELMPDGKISISPIDGGTDADDTVKITIPLHVADVTASTVMSTSTSTEIEASSDLAFDAEFTGSIGLHGDDLVLSFDSVAIANLQGGITAGSEELTAAELQEKIQDKLDDMKDDLARIALPRITEISDLAGLTIEVSAVEANTRGLFVGFDIGI